MFIFYYFVTCIWQLEIKSGCEPIELSCSSLCIDLNSQSDGLIGGLDLCVVARYERVGYLIILCTIISWLVVGIKGISSITICLGQHRIGVPILPLFVIQKTLQNLFVCVISH